MRTIKIFSQSSGGLRELDSSAKNWGELQKEVYEYVPGGTKAMIRETKTTLEDPGALLPSSPFTVYVVPDKIKAGA